MAQAERERKARGGRDELESMRLPPQNLEAERSVLGCILLTKDALPVVIDLLDPDDFYRESHRHIYQAMEDLEARGMTIDQITLADELKKRNLLDAVGGLAFLFEDFLTHDLEF